MASQHGLGSGSVGCEPSYASVQLVRGSRSGVIASILVSAVLVRSVRMYACVSPYTVRDIADRCVTQATWHAVCMYYVAVTLLYVQT